MILIIEYKSHFKFKFEFRMHRDSRWSDWRSSCRSKKKKLLARVRKSFQESDSKFTFQLNTFRNSNEEGCKVYGETHEITSNQSQLLTSTLKLKHKSSKWHVWGMPNFAHSIGEVLTEHVSVPHDVVQLIKSFGGEALSLRLTFGIITLALLAVVVHNKCLFTYKSKLISKVFFSPFNLLVARHVCDINLKTFIFICQIILFAKNTRKRFHWEIPTQRILKSRATDADERKTLKR